MTLFDPQIYCFGLLLGMNKTILWFAVFSLAKLMNVNEDQSKLSAIARSFPSLFLH